MLGLPKAQLNFNCAKLVVFKVDTWLLCLLTLLNFSYKNMAEFPSQWNYNLLRTKLEAT